MLHLPLLDVARCMLHVATGGLPAVGDGAAVQQPRQEDDAQRIPRVRPLGPLLAVVSTLLLMSTIQSIRCFRALAALIAALSATSRTLTNHKSYYFHDNWFPYYTH